MTREISTLKIEKHKVTQFKKQGYTRIEDAINSNILEEELLTSLIKAPLTKTAWDLLIEEESFNLLNTSNKNLDLILKNELIPNTIVELVGLPGSGKTQLCFQLCISAQLSTFDSDTPGEAVFVSTNKNFCKERLKDIVLKNLNHNAKTFNNVDEILKRIHFVKVATKTDLLSFLNNLEEFLKTKRVKILIIDSISYPMREVEVDKRKILFSRIFKSLRKISLAYKFAVVITNDMTTRVNNLEAYETPSFGDSYYHNINTRIILSRENCGFNAKIVKSVHKSCISVNFDI